MVRRLKETDEDYKSHRGQLEMERNRGSLPLEECRPQNVGKYFPVKVGDKVRVVSKDLFESRMDKHGCLRGMARSKISPFFGKAVTISNIVDDCYCQIEEDDEHLYWNRLLFDCKVEDAFRVRIGSCDDNESVHSEFYLGDKVRVRDGKWFDENYAASANGDIEFFVNGRRDMYAAPYGMMSAYFGKVVEITSKTSDGTYQIGDCPCYWNGDMFECKVDTYSSDNDGDNGCRSDSAEETDCGLKDELHEVTSEGGESDNKMDNEISSDSNCGSKSDSDSDSCLDNSLRSDDVPKVKYKIGDSVRVKPKEWFEDCGAIRTGDLVVPFKGRDGVDCISIPKDFIGMAGKTLDVKWVNVTECDCTYLLGDVDYHVPDSVIDCKVKDATDEKSDAGTEYKVGDIVLIRPFSWCSKRIRPDENCIRIKEGDREYIYFSPFMGEYCGKVVAIANVVEADGVLLYECRHEGKRIDCYLVGSLFERRVVGKDSGMSPVESESSGGEREMESLQDKFAKFKYKEGDKVRVKPREWFDRYEMRDGRICCDDWGSADGVHGVRFYTAILEHCGEVVEISGLSIGLARGVHIYSAKGIGYTFAEEFFEDEVVERKSVEVGGEHYQMPIQPIEFIMANGIPFCEGNVIKYVCRHRRKNGAEDIRKAIHYLEIILEKIYNVKKDKEE